MNNTTAPMTEKEYWGALYAAIQRQADDLFCQRFGALDGLSPKRYCLGEPSPRIEVEMTFLRHPGVVSERCVVMLDAQWTSLEAIEWRNLVPTSDFRNWCHPQEDLIVIGVEPPNQSLQPTGSA